jgi:nucleotide-binding universal stress UspA family protein
MSWIVVGVDGSPSSQVALGWAMTEAGLRRVPLAVLTVIPAAVEASGVTGQMSPLDESFSDERRTEVQRATQDIVDKAVAERAGQPEVTVTVRAVAGLVADELIQASGDADLLVVAARGAGGFARLIMGSVSTQVAHHARCPVVVIPAGWGS